MIREVRGVHEEDHLYAECGGVWTHNCHCDNDRLLRGQRCKAVADGNNGIRRDCGCAIGDRESFFEKGKT